MSIANIREKGLSKVSRGSVIVGTLAVILGLIAAFVGWNLYKKAATTTVVAYFADALAVYPGDRVQIMGVKVGNVSSVELGDGDKTAVVGFTLEEGRKVRAEAAAHERDATDKARTQAQAAINEAQRKMRTETEAARAQLLPQADALARSIASKLLGREVA
jgi:hypothetical protein